VVHVHDWDGDGDLDLLVGDIEGRVSLVPNESGNETMKYGKPVRLAVERTEIRAPGGNSCPVVADWDGDGRHDLVLGCGDGSVLFLRDSAVKGAPVLAKPVQLVAASKGSSKSSPITVASEHGPSPCGRRAKLAIHDWDGDGRDDLLLGDVTWWRLEPSRLTAEQIARRDELRTGHAESFGALRRLYEERGARVDQQARRALGLDEKLSESELIESLPEEKRQAYLKKRGAILTADPEYKQLMDRNEEIWQELQKYDGATFTHGHVWLFLREG
jgi:hypothetical protein